MRLIPSPLIALVSLAFPVLANQAANGFQSVDLPSSPNYLSVALSNGDWVGLDDNSIELFAADGSLLRTLYQFGNSLPQQSIAIDPTETYVLAGRWDGGVGGSYRVSLSGPPSLFTMPFRHGQRIVFEDPQHALLSGSDGVGGFNVFRLDIFTGMSAWSSATFGGSLGPIAMDASGNLYVGHNTFGPKGSVIERFTPAQIAGPQSIAPGTGVVVADGFNDPGHLAVSPDASVLYVGESPFSGTHQILEVQTSTASKTTLLTIAPGESLIGLQLVPPTLPAKFLPFQPPAGGQLIYQTALSGIFRKSLEPARPTLTLTGPGTVGIGSVAATLDGGPPFGFGLLLYGPTNLYSPVETAYPLSIPLFLGLELTTLQRTSSLLVLDPSGSAVQNYNNQSGTLGLWAIQVVLFDHSAALVGSSTAAFL